MTSSPPGQELLYHWLRSTFRIKVNGSERVPTNGAVIVATNHSGIVGGLLMASHLVRPLVFIATVDWARVPIWGALMQRYGQVWISTASVLDNRFLDHCRHVLDSGHMLGVMIDGKETNHQFGLPKRGAAYLAARLGAKLLPIRFQRQGRSGCLHVAAPLAGPETVNRDDLITTTNHLVRHLFPSMGTE